MPQTGHDTEETKPNTINVAMHHNTKYKSDFHSVWPGAWLTADGQTTIKQSKIVACKHK